MVLLMVSIITTFILVIFLSVITSMSAVIIILIICLGVSCAVIVYSRKAYSKK